MKLFLISVLIIFCSVQIGRSQVNFQSVEWNAALTQAKASNKYVFVDCYTTWCYWCKVMDKQTFPVQKVSSFMNAHFVATRIDMERGFGKTVALKYNIMSYPTYLVLSPAGELVYEIDGFQDSTTFLQSLASAIDPQAQQHFPGYSASMTIAYPAFERTSLDTRKQPSMEEVTTYLNGQKDLFSEANWSVLVHYNALTPKYGQYVVENRKKYSDLYGKDAVNDIIARYYQPLYDTAVKKKDDQLLNTYFTQLQEHGINDTLSKTGIQLQFYSAVGHYAKLVDMLEQMKLDTNNLDMLNNFCWECYTWCNDATTIHRTTSLMQRVTGITKNYGVWDTYVALLYKDKQYDKAETVALQAIALAKAEHESTRSTDFLLPFIQSANHSHSLVYNKPVDCSYAIVIDSHYSIAAPYVDTTTLFDGTKTIDSVRHHDGLKYMYPLDKSRLDFFAKSPITIFSIKNVTLWEATEGYITLNYKEGGEYRAQFFESTIPNEAQKKISQLHNGDTITFQNIHTSYKDVVIPTEIQFVVSEGLGK